MTSGNLFAFDGARWKPVKGSGNVKDSCLLLIESAFGVLVFRYSAELDTTTPPDRLLPQHLQFQRIFTDVPAMAFNTIDEAITSFSNVICAT